MTPPLARPVLSAICGALRAQTGTAARRTGTPGSRFLPSVHRPLGTTPSKDAHAATAARTAAEEPTATVLPPESPNYVLVPTPPQNAEHKPPPIKGHLPVPRDIFTRRTGGGPTKGAHAAAHVQAVLPRSAAEQEGRPARSAAEAARRADTDMRRRNLEAGLAGLWERHEATAGARAERGARRAAENRAAALAPDRDDDLFTRPTVSASTRRTAVPLDPLRFERAEAARERTAAAARRKSDDRRDALAHLYMAAGSFIVDEAELERRVEAEFAAGVFQGGLGFNGESVWDVWGVPPSVADLVRDMDGISFPSRVAQNAHTDSHDRTAKRQMIVSEHLTGGKLD
ncbi:hypothetical protein P8C59_008247 [Phyllachora maydis]|uniref:Uncharacterized protein n=1 Tax=Phyllachora maydis TaxID=1825666 RepID=A0AAD9MGK7_9PEZI|nr:hypothetical protein P8C59_008247 [Phyllachora maydis]